MSVYFERVVISTTQITIVYTPKLFVYLKRHNIINIYFIYGSRFEYCICIKIAEY